MAFRAELEIDKMKYRVLEYGYTMSRPFDMRTGQVAGGLQAGRINFTAEIVPGQSLWPYMHVNQVIRSARVELWGAEKGGTQAENIIKTLELTNAHVVELTENFSAVGGQPATMSFTLSCERIKEDGAEHENEWSRASEGR